ncbi:hypothetical protein [Microbulbifer sp. SAOS-129_SWC]|uniref:hypothetical protein n=1 Tax=Microbulbifer sp. SAOS-129_SWC TaxID=3145235 RepID=UPI003217AF61
MKNTLLILLLALAVTACGQRADKSAGAAQAPENETAQKPAPEASATGQETPAAEQGTQTDEQRGLLWIFRTRGNRQCQDGGMSLKESSAMLADNGIAVHESLCGVRTDLDYSTQCGGPTGDLLLHLIENNALNDALDLGYGPAEQIQYEKVDCPE